MSSMQIHALAQPLAYLGAVLGIGMVIPQVVRTIRHPDLTGVSAMAWGLTALSCLTWFAYGLRTAAIPQLPGNVFLVTGAVTVVMLVPAAYSRRRRILILGAAAMMLMTLATVLPAQTVGYIAFSIGLCAAWPQLIESFSNRRARVLSGVSLATLSVRLMSILCWMSYAILAADVPVIIASTFGLVTTIAILGMEGSLRLSGNGRLESLVEPEFERV
jgi:uncharacterized protein with PQ loop repeat